MQKNNVYVKINLSQPILVRTKCKYCQQEPSIYYSLPYKAFPNDVKAYYKDASKTKTYIKRMSSDWFLAYDPKQFSRSNTFSFILYDKGLSASHWLSQAHKYHRHYEYLSCDCEGTVWVVQARMIDDIPSRQHRKARITFPRKFLDF